MSKFNIAVITILTVLIVATIFITLIREQQYINEIDRITSEYASSQESHLKATSDMIDNYNHLYYKYITLYQNYVDLGKQKGFSDNWDEYVITAYNANDPQQGTNNITAIGVDLERRWTSYFQFIAVDPEIIPLGSIVEIEDMGYFLAVDTGGLIKGKIIDVLFDEKHEAIEFGRQKRKVRVY